MRCPSKILYKRLKAAYGSKERWWPGEGTFEVVVGALLTQNTSWQNVEKAINNLKQVKALSPQAILNMPLEKLQDLIRPAGFYRQKAERLKALVKVVLEGSIDRGTLLDVKGIGKETADSILLYGYNKPFFVVDAYTRRLCSRLMEVDCMKIEYDELAEAFTTSLPKDAAVYKELHALIVEHAKQRCLKRQPKCESCPLKNMCLFYTRGPRT